MFLNYFSGKINLLYTVNCKCTMEKLVDKKKGKAGVDVFVERVKKLSIGNKFHIIIAAIVIILLIEVASFYFVIRTMNGIRVFVAGEDFWTKAQKNEHYALQQYASTYDESYYDKIQGFINVYLGNHNARIEMEKPDMNYAYVKQQFILGGVHPGDVSDAVFVFRWFRHVYYFEKAVEFWSGGDTKIEAFTVISQRIHAIITTPLDKNDPEAQAKKDAEISALIKQENILDTEVTVLENGFAAILGEGSRAMKTILFFLSLGITVVLGLFIILITRFFQITVLKTDHEKSEFITLASHQLRTPSTAIKWYLAELLGKGIGELNETQRKYAQIVSDSNEWMLKIINNLLRITTIDAGELSINIAPVDVRKVLESVVKEYRSAITKKNINVTIDQLGNLSSISTDSFWLKIILQNLISNAVKYTPDNGNVICTARMEGFHMLIAVRDSGPGILQKEQANIFRKLFWASTTTGKGTGLGLHIVKRLTDILGGEIWFESEVNKGTTFYLRLPLRISGA